jgi:uncharacterized protein
MKTRLEALDARHPEMVALMAGPLVLFAVGESEPSVTRAQLLASKRTSAPSWEVATVRGPLKMLTWTAIEEQPYTTYLRVG